MSDELIRAEALSKRFALRTRRRPVLAALREALSGLDPQRELWALADASFGIDRGERVAVIGANGCGKTTLLRLIAGIFRPTRGSLTVRAEPRVLFRSGVGLTPELSVVDNILLFGAVHGIDRGTLIAKLRWILEFSELETMAYAPLKSLSLGQVRRLALSTFLEGRGDLLILDEGLDNVDEAFRRRVVERLQGAVRGDTTFLMTSHDPELLRELCGKGLWLEAGRLRQAGDLDSVLSAYQRSVRDHP